MPTACSEADSTAAANSRTASPSQPFAATTALTVNRPVVRVPVLSKTTVSTARVASSARWPLRKIPSCAPRPDATIIAVGVARPNAHGQAMTSTASAAANARSGPPPAISHAIAVTAEMANTQGTNTAAMRSASRCASAFCVWASSTRRTIPANWVSAPTAAASTISLPSKHDRATDDAATRTHPQRLGLTGHGAHVHGGRALHHETVGGDRLARPHDEAVLLLEFVGRDGHLRPVGQQDDDVLRAQRRQRAQRSARLRLGAGLEVPPGQNEDGDAGRDFEVDRVAAYQRLPNALATRRNGGHRTPCRATRWSLR